MTGPGKEKPFRTFHLKRMDESSNVTGKVEVFVASVFSE